MAPSATVAVATSRPRAGSHRAQRHRIAWGVVTPLTIGVVLASLASGAESVSLPVLARVLASPALPVDASDDMALAHTVVWVLRIPRLLFALLFGATLAVAGSALQGMVRNPLADPGLLGVSSGGAAGAAIAIVGGSTTGVATGLGVPLAACLGAGAATALVLVLARRGGRIDTITLLLAGIAVNAFAGAILGLCTAVASDTQLRNLAFWTLGALGGVTWDSLRWIVPSLLVALVALLRRARSLDLLLLGEREAAHLGVRPQRLTWTIAGAVALGVGVGTAFAGLIGFVGLVVPHLVRLAVGPAHVRLLPLAAVAGATLLAGADVLARTVVAPIELPIGVLTAFIGAPTFLALILRRRV
jgi:iron complex transport system permease protein